MPPPAVLIISPKPPAPPPAAAMDHTDVGHFGPSSAKPSRLSKPRLAKARRQLGPSRSRVPPPADAELRPGFNPFRSVQGSDAGFVFGACRIQEGMDKLNLKDSTDAPSQCRDDDGGADGKLLEEVRKLNLHESGHGVGNQDHSSTEAFVSDNAEPDLSNLPDAIKKLNLYSDEGEGDGDGGTEKRNVHDETSKHTFIFGSSKTVPPMGRSSSSKEDLFVDTNEAKIQEGIRKLKLNRASSSDNISINALPDEMNNLNIKEGIPENTKKGQHYRTASFLSEKNTCTEHVFGSSTGLTSSTLQSTVPGCVNDLDARGKTDIQMPSGLATGSGVVFDHCDRVFEAQKQDKDIHQSDDQCVPPLATTSSSYPSTHVSSFGPTTRGFTFTGTNLKSTDGKAPIQDSSQFKGKLFGGPHQRMVSGMKKGSQKGAASKKKKGNTRNSTIFHQSFSEHCTSTEEVLQEDSEHSPGCYSPMDYSPYRETQGDIPHFQEVSTTSVDSFNFPSNCMSVDASMVPEGLSSKVDDGVCTVTEGISNVQLNVTGESSGVNENDNIGADKRNLESIADAKIFDKVDGHVLFQSCADQDGEHGASSSLASNIEATCEPIFAFSAQSVPGRPSIPKRHFRKTDRVKVGPCLLNSISESKTCCASYSPVMNTSTPQVPVQSIGNTMLVPPSGSGGMQETGNKLEIKLEPVSTKKASIAAQESCAKWRLRGNQAYASGLLIKAEEYYTRGVSSVPSTETSKSCLQELMLCYSNRAAARMSLGKMREALSDCLNASSIDPNFFKAKLRAGNCHLALGETEDAMKYFKSCLQYGNTANADGRLSTEASEGLQKVQKLIDFMHESVELLEKTTIQDARKALSIISEALLISPLSERLIEMKAESLLVMRSFEEVIQFCQETVDLSERNLVMADYDGQFKDTGGSDNKKILPDMPWRWRLTAKSYFYLGKLDEALDLFKKHEQEQALVDRYRSEPPMLPAPFSVTICELLRLKAAGNEAFQARKHFEAVENYTAALTLNTESRPFTAILFCNRAAAYQALGQIADAIADCSLAIALDGSYAKALSRRAALHETIRDYVQAANDLRRLSLLLEKQVETIDRNNEIKQVRLRLSTAEEESRKDIPLDMYMILGTQQSCSVADVKKAYRKAALKHHPDKAAQSLARSENGNDCLWKDIADEVHMDADRLFKMIGEAYAILSDPSKRLQYDEQEEIRAGLKKNSGEHYTPRQSRTPTDYYSSPFDRSVNRRYWDGPKQNGSSHTYYSDYYRSNRW